MEGGGKGRDKHNTYCVCGEGVGERDRPNRGETKDSFMGEKRNGDVLKQR